MMVAGTPRPMAMESYVTLPFVSTIFRAARGIAVPVPATNDLARALKKETCSAPADGVAAAASAAAELAAGTCSAPLVSHGADGAAAAARSVARLTATATVRKAIAAHKASFDARDPRDNVPLCI